MILQWHCKPYTALCTRLGTCCACHAVFTACFPRCSSFSALLLPCCSNTPTPPVVSFCSDSRSGQVSKLDMAFSGRPWGPAPSASGRAWTLPSLPRGSGSLYTMRREARDPGGHGGLDVMGRTPRPQPPRPRGDVLPRPCPGGDVIVLMVHDPSSEITSDNLLTAPWPSRCSSGLRGLVGGV